MALHFGTPWLIVFLPFGWFYLAWQHQKRSFVRLGPARRRLALMLRIALVTFVLLALAQPVLVTSGRSVSTLVAVDVSRSIGDRTLEETRALVRHAWEADKSRLEVVTFAGHARRASTGALGPEVGRHDPDATRLDEAIAFARGSAASATRLVLITDGRDGAVDEARRAHEAGWQIDVVRPPGAPLRDARVTALLLPESLRVHEPARATVRIESTHPGQATLRFDENGFFVDERAVTLRDGVTSVDVDFQPAVSGLGRYRAQITLAGDEIGENDRFTQLALVTGPPRILLAAETPEEGEHLEEALSVQGLNVESVSPSSLPTTVDGLVGFDEVILAGVPLDELDRLRQAALASWVRDAGGGLLFVAGRQGLRRDPEGKAGALEPVLPVELAAPSERDEPPVALVLLIDRSGSMTGEKLQFAKQAALAVIDKLTAQDQLGVIAFDAKFDWILPLAPIDDKARVKAQVGALGAGGGTRFYPALEEAYFTLASAEAAARHAVLLTDGVSTDPDIFAALLAKARKAGVTVSTVAIGKGADLKLLGEIARLGGGRYSMAASADQVPNIFVHEAETVQREASQRRDTPVVQVARARELAGIDFTHSPPLAGYVRTRAKAGSEPLLETNARDPLLVRWRYGLGQVVAFTSDATTVWGARWLGWAGFGKLWTQLVRGMARAHDRNDLALSLRADGGRLQATVDAIDAEGRFLDGWDVRAELLDADGRAREVALPQVAPGRYATWVGLPSTTVLARPFADRAGRRVDGEWAVLARPYPEELLHTGTDESALSALARAGGGVVGGAELLSSSTGTARRERPLAPPLTLLALLLLVGDLAVRRAQWEAGA